MVSTQFNSSQTNQLSNTFVGLGRNRIINGEMSIDQRFAGTAFTVNTSSTFGTIDMWKAVGQTGDGVYTVQRSLTTPATGFDYYLRSTVTTADASVDVNQFYFLQYALEGNMIRDFLWGTIAAKTITLSFWARSSVTGSFSIAFKNAASDRIYATLYTINAANTWEYKTITVPGDTTGTWNTGSSVGLVLDFALGMGSNRVASTNNWQASAGTFAATGLTQLISTLNATLDLTGMQLELGSSATPFEYRPFPIELALCQRYFETSYPMGTAPGTASTFNIVQVLATNINGAMESSAITYKVTKRVLPTIVLYNYSTGATASGRWFNSAGSETTRATAVDAPSTNNFSVYQTVSTSDTLAYIHFTADASL